MTTPDTIAKVVASTGARLYDIEIRREGDNTIYCIIIKADGGVTLDLCEQVSRLLSPILDLDPPMSGKYFLEVSSPGIERKLKTADHFAQSIGEKAKLTFKNGDKAVGTISKVEGETIVLTLDDGTEATVSYGDISRARTVFDW